MKIYLPIFLCLLLFACSSSKPQPSKNSIANEDMVIILKEIHLADAVFELSKVKGVLLAKNELAEAYKKIYDSYSISEDEFKESLLYLSERPEELEAIYNEVLKVLAAEQTTLNH